MLLLRLAPGDEHLNWTFATATAYQATDTSKAAAINLSISSTAALSLSGGTTNSADVYISSTAGVATSGGTSVCSYSNANTGTLTIGLALNQVVKAPCNISLPAG